MTKPSWVSRLAIATLLLVVGQAQAENDQWADVIAKAAESVVSLQLAHLRNFDDAEQGGSNATGFVVDAEMGIVLTNRHVVGSGPIRLSATFQNQERVDAVPLYRDPVHDFAFIRYDPAELKYANPQTLPLRPDKASTGLNIRVIGSDGGEQLSILAGTIARLDREVPSYGRYGYNDFNTFYFQAASSTSGGSSGSPVIDFDGDVVALNAAANRQTASSFFLPLHRIQSALDKLRQQQAVPRGGLQTLFRHKPFRELSRLGLGADIESQARRHDPDNSGMLTVAQVIPGGVAHGQLQEGDILISINDSMITNFVELEALLDEHIGQTLSVQVVRQAKLLTVQSSVADLHQLAPDRFIELGDAVLQNMSIQHARAMNLPQTGVVVMNPGYFFTRAGVPQSSVITRVNGKDVSDIHQFLEIVSESPENKKLRLRFTVPGREFTPRIAQLNIDDRWFDYRECSRRDSQRFWQCDTVDLKRASAEVDDQEVQVPSFKDPLLARVAPALVHIDFNIPYSIDNVYARNYSGVGVVIDKELGLVAVDRNTVPIGLGDAELTFFGSLIVDATVVFLHPRHNIALVQYDPSELRDAEFEALELADADTELPDSLTMIGYRADGTFRAHELDGISRLTISFKAPGLPRFQQSMLDVFGVANVPPALGGPFVSDDGVVHGFYFSFAYEESREIKQRNWLMPAAVVAESLRLYRSGSDYFSMDASFSYRPLSFARQLGLPDEFVARYNNQTADSRRALFVEQVVPSTDAAKKLRSGDIILSVDGELVTDIFSLETLSQQAELTLEILRDAEVLTLGLKPSPIRATGTERLVSWGGAIFQEPHEDIGYLKAVDFPGVYVSSTDEGSPALWDGLYRNRFVTAIDGVDINNLDELLDQVKNKAQDEITRLSLISMSGRKSIVTVQPEYNFFPTFEIRRTDAGWQRLSHQHP
ncbi:MAG: trypsin-like peptidase domain-containing protein [Gammaproteobacteria bacterium]|nr:trypsin-like peptidase domain-containing protein [Gammaproteobacteria bacterium]